MHITRFVIQRVLAIESNHFCAHNEDYLTVRLTCSFLFSGEDTSLTCQRNSRWSKPKAVCVVQCKPLDQITYDNGKLKTTSCIKGPQPVGTQCKVRCQEGYHVQDERTKRYRDKYVWWRKNMFDDVKNVWWIYGIYWYSCLGLCFYWSMFENYQAIRWWHKSKMYS